MLRTREAPPALQGGRGGPAIEARGLAMRYGDREVLHGIDLTVPQGMVVGFLGPNGAGRALIFGHGPGAIWSDLGKLLAWLVAGLLVSLRTFRWERAA
jgi:ABC-type sugar transport system ATPase subunit